MKSTQSLNGLKLYSKKLRLCRKVFNCPDCGKSILPKEYEKHCSQQHQINGKTNCVWCRRESWQSGLKHKYACHLQVCFQKSMASIGTLPASLITNQQVKLLNLTHEFPQKIIFDFPNLPTDKYDSLWPLDVDPPPIEFRDDNLNLAASYVVKYFQLKDTHDWMHVMVKAVAFDSFLRALDQDQGITQTLLFSCWCNGGHYKEVRHRQHRHLIVVSLKNHFEKKFWPKVKVFKEDKPNRNFPCKRFKHIQSPMHLVNTMGYLSHRKSKCKFTFKDGRGTAYKMHHFYLYRSLPIHFRLPLVLFWDGGISQLLYIEKFQNISISHVVENPMTFVDNKWKQKIRDFYGHERGLVLPVSKRFMATNQVTPLALYLMNGRKLYFQSCQENELLDDETWLRKQAEGGNCFYDAVENELWTPRNKYQHFLCVYKPTVDRNRQLESENANLKRKCEELELENKSKQIKIDKLHEEFKAKTDILYLEIKLKQAKIDELHAKIDNLNEEEKARLKLENEQLKKTVDELKKTVEELRMKEYQKNNEIARLKMEIKRLKREK